MHHAPCDCLANSEKNMYIIFFSQLSYRENPKVQNLYNGQEWISEVEL